MWITRSASHLPYGRRPASSRLIWVSGTIASRSRSTRKSLPGEEPALGGHLAGRHLDHAGLRGEHHPAVLRHEPAPGAQAVPVERRADHAPVAEGHRRGAVPRLHERRVVGEEVAHLLRQLRAALVRLRDQHRDGVLGRAAAEHEQLHEAVERGRVGDVVAQERMDLPDVVAEVGRGELELAGAHPVPVAAQRVDLAVVGEHPVRVRQLPAREGVRGEARVHEREAAHHALVAQLREVARELRRGEHALQHHGAAREARDVEVLERLLLDAAPDHVELALEGVLAGNAVAGRHEELGDPGRHRARGRAAGGLVHRDLAPAEHVLALGLGPLLEEPHGLGGVARREEAERHSVPARLGQVEVDLRAEELVGELDQDARTVPGVGVGALGAAVLQALERMQRTRNHLVRGGGANPRYEGDAAGVMLVARVVQATRCLQRGHLLFTWPARLRRTTRTRTGNYKAMAMLPTAQTITVLSQKGGTGKTTTVRTLADTFRRAGLEVLVTDMDPQGNLSDYYDVPGGRDAHRRGGAGRLGEGGRRRARRGAPRQPGPGRGGARARRARWAAS